MPLRFQWQIEEYLLQLLKGPNHLILIKDWKDTPRRM